MPDANNTIQTTTTADSEIKTKWGTIPSVVAIALITALNAGISRCSSPSEDYKTLSAKLDTTKEDQGKIREELRTFVTSQNRSNDNLANDINFLKLKLELKDKEK